jgi:hypothetical protein
MNYVKFGKCSPPVRPPGEELIRKCRFDELIGLFKKVAIEQPKIEINIEKKKKKLQLLRSELADTVDIEGLQKKKKKVNARVKKRDNTLCSREYFYA